MNKFFKVNLLALALLGSGGAFAQSQYRGIETLNQPTVRTSEKKVVSPEEEAQLKLQNKCFNNEKAGRVNFNYGTEGNQVMNSRTTYLCNLAYNAVYDPETKNPLWVSQTLTGKPKVIADLGLKARQNPNLPAHYPQPTVDYGDEDMTMLQLAPAEDMDYSGTGREKGQAIEESFYYTNVVPVVPNFKENIWNDVEQQVRDWSVGKEISVVTGVIFDNLDQPAVYGPSKVWIPTRIYKAVYEPKTGKSIAFVVPNVQVITTKAIGLREGTPDYWQTEEKHAYRCKGTCTLKNFVTSVAQVEKAANVKLFPKSAGVDFTKIAPSYWNLKMR